jgi:hypothetical protein
MTEPVILRVDPGTSNHRMSLLHDALRDLDLELCAGCDIWKPVARIITVGIDFAASGGPSFTSTRCTDCTTKPQADWS